MNKPSTFFSNYWKELFVLFKKEVFVLFIARPIQYQSINLRVVWLYFMNLTFYTYYLLNTLLLVAVFPGEKKKKKKKISLLCCMRSLTESTVFIITVALISLWICFKHLYFDQTVYVCLLVKKSKTSHLQRFQKNQEIFLLQIFGNISFGNIIFCKCYG